MNLVHSSLHDDILRIDSLFYVSAGITEEIKGAETWLAHGRSPWPKVLAKWVQCAPLRFRSLYQSEAEFVNSYILKWTVLTHASGHELVCIAFHWANFFLFWCQSF